jgi:hypothetical protein
MSTTTEPLRGYPLVVEALAHIELDPRSWDQSQWAMAITTAIEGAKSPEVPQQAPDCGTQFCLAGWVNLLGGRRLRWRNSDMYENPAGVWKRYWHGDVLDEEGIRRSPSASAVELLEVADSPGFYSDYLFSGSLNLEDLHYRVARTWRVTVDQLAVDIRARMEQLQAEMTFPEGRLGTILALANTAAHTAQPSAL